MSLDDRDGWEAKHRERSGEPLPPPAPFVAENAALLRPGRTLDLAAGSGRNAAFLAALGHRVIAADIAKGALDRIRRGVPIAGFVQVDLDDPCFRTASLDNVVCVDFLDRRLFREIRRWLRPGGGLLFDAFLVDQAAIGHPRNPAFLLRHGELREALSGYRLLRHREGEVVEPAARSFRAGAVAIRDG